MLAFDIETEGLQQGDAITVASIYDPERQEPPHIWVRYIASLTHTRILRGIKKSFFFTRSEEEANVNKEEFLRHLDEAEVICCFNGVRFDLPAIIDRFHVPRERYEPRFFKVTDLFEICKCVFGSSCSLNKLLEANGHEVKSSDGLQAVEWAKQGEWEKLDEYCMRDTILTYEITSQARVIMPLTGHPHVCCVSKSQTSIGRRYFFHE